MNNFFNHIFLSAFFILGTGCVNVSDNYNYGYTRADANEKFLLIDEERETFGHYRYSMFVSLNRLEKFMEDKMSHLGEPDFIYQEGSVSKLRTNLYYLSHNKVHLYRKDGIKIFHVHERGIHDFEYEIFNKIYGQVRSLENLKNLHKEESPSAPPKENIATEA